MENDNDTIRPEVYLPTHHDSFYAAEIRLQEGKYSVVLVNGSHSDAEWVVTRLQKLLFRPHSKQEAA